MHTDGHLHLDMVFTISLNKGRALLAFVGVLIAFSPFRVVKAKDVTIGTPCRASV